MRGKFHLWLLIRFYYYKYIRRLDIIGFHAGVPVIRTKYLEDVVDDYTERVLGDLKDYLDSEGSK